MAAGSTGSTHSPLMNSLVIELVHRVHDATMTAYPVLIVALPLKDEVSKV